ncbi:hypothetical protein OAS39_12920, partial [Pirellulales bacterium]|nr:hypothetical protein [Pirellulales bacterium]
MPSAHGEDAATSLYARHIQPILTKYCVGCHNQEDREGGFSLETFSDVQQGLDDGPVILAGQPNSSRLYRVVSGLAEPRMPPEDHEGPNAEEIAVLKSWIEAGANGPVGSQLDRPRLIVPAIARRSTNMAPAITAIAASPTTDQVALARFGKVEVRKRGAIEPSFELTDFPGKINAINFSESGDLFVTASGVAGLYGQADLFDAQSGERQLSLAGHRDTLYDAELSPNGNRLATASYDGTITLWDIATGAALYTAKGHNGAVFDVEFDPSGQVLASASADATVKLWKVATGERLDTLSQPTAEQYTVAFSPDGKHIVAGGADNRIRVWGFVSRDARQINPLRFTRFAHDIAVTHMRFALDGLVLVTAGDDQLVRLWETQGYGNSRLLTELPASIHDLSVNSVGDKAVVGLLDGSAEWHEVTAVASSSNARNRSVVDGEAFNEPSPEKAAARMDEQEPNDEVNAAQQIKLPTQLHGVVHAIREGQKEDVDLYKFRASEREEWIFEIKAARDKSPLDSKIEVLTAEGERIERVLLQAVRDSYFTFRGK